MGASYTKDDLHIPPGGGEATATDMVIKVRSAQLGGDFSIMEGTVGPKKLLAPHTHEHEDQCVFIIEGELEFEVGGEDGLHFLAGPGSYVLKPRGVSHAFWNPSSTTTVRYIELSGRDGFEKFVDMKKEGLLKSTVKSKLELGVTTHVTQIPRLLAAHKLDGLAAVNLDTE